MQYLIDGHNLIPKLGLQLDSIDDEETLIPRLQEFCRQRRAEVEVFFDGAPPGHNSRGKVGMVTVQFVPQRSSADAAIENRLLHLGKSAQNWSVVSSDGRVQQAGRAAHAHVLSSEEFAADMEKSQREFQATKKQEAALSPAEVEEWLDLFKKKKRG